MSTEAEAIASDFLEFSRKKLAEEFWPRICVCLDALTDDQIWWRPNEKSNSIGNLLLHLNGNLRQWIVSAIGEKTDDRQRDAEFAKRTQIPVQELKDHLSQTLAEVESILKSLKAADLQKVYTIQRYEGVTALNAVYHVTEHFGMHCGQILYITKLLTDRDLGFYKHLSGT